MNPWREDVVGIFSSPSFTSKSTHHIYPITFTPFQNFTFCGYWYFLKLTAAFLRYIEYLFKKVFCIYFVYYLLNSQAIFPSVFLLQRFSHSIIIIIIRLTKTNKHIACNKSMAAHPYCEEERNTLVELALAIVTKRQKQKKKEAQKE